MNYPKNDTQNNRIFAIKKENMTTAYLLSGKSKLEMKSLLEIARKLGLKVRSISPLEMEDFGLASEIERGLKSERVSREKVKKALQG